MKDDFLIKLEKRLRLVLVLLGLFAAAGVVLLIRFSQNRTVQPEQAEEETVEEDSWEMGLSDSTYWLPKYSYLYDDLSGLTFQDQAGHKRSLSEWKGTPVILMYFASWCEDCQKQMDCMQQFEELAKSYGDIPVLYLNRTDGERESQETASAYFEKLGLSGDCYFDVGERVFTQLGLRNIPTTLFLDETGKLISISVEPLVSAGVFEAKLQEQLQGNSFCTSEFIRNNLLDDQGGVHLQYEPGKGYDSSSMILSESQGLYLLYAAEAGNKQLFDELLDYVKTYMWKDALTMWKVQNGQPESVNALIDDFRIYRAVYQARKQWGGYEKELDYLESNLKRYGIAEQNYVDFYQEDSNAYASRLTLCYVDLAGMELLAERKQDTYAAYTNAAQLLEQGQISNEFPLYYSWYNYDKQRYERDDLNTAEAMVTLLHLSRQGLLKNNTVKWLKAQLSGEGLKARYTVDGQVVKGYNYESTAVYGLVAMIADEIGDTTLRGQALNKMEKTRIANTKLDYNGAFGMEDGTGITSFDQLIPLLTYAQMEKGIAKNTMR